MALRLAVDRPELIRSVVVYEVPFLSLLDDSPKDDRELPAMGAQLARLRAAAGRGEGGTALRGYLDLFGALEEEWSAMEPTTREAFSENGRCWAEEMGDPEATAPPLAELRGVAVPVLALAGGRSPGFAGRIHARLVSELPNATALVLPDGGHLAPRNEPDLLVGVLGTFLLERNVPST